MGSRDRQKSTKAVCLVIGFACLACGCRLTPDYENSDFMPVAPPPIALGTPEEITPIPSSNPFAHLERYPLRVADQIAFTLSIDPRTQGTAYLLMVNDQLTVEYLHEPPPGNRPRTMRVLPDGTIDLPQIGSIMAAGKTVDRLTREINTRAKEFYRHPRISVTATKAMGQAEELRRAFSTGFTNQSLTVVVTPDGMIDLPEIGRVEAFGRTLPELRDEVNGQYKRIVLGVSVWPHLVQRAPDQVHVLGQVPNPGLYRLDRPTHISQLIALAGGYNLGSELEKVILIRYHEGSPLVRQINIHRAIWWDQSAEEVDLTDDILLADGDVVVVPRDHTQKGNDFVRRFFIDGLYGIIPLPRLTR